MSNLQFRSMVVDTIIEFDGLSREDFSWLLKLSSAILYSRYVEITRNGGRRFQNV